MTGFNWDQLAPIILNPIHLQYNFDIFSALVINFVLKNIRIVLQIPLNRLIVLPGVIFKSTHE